LHGKHKQLKKRDGFRFKRNRMEKRVVKGDRQERVSVRIKKEGAKGSSSNHSAFVSPERRGNYDFNGTKFSERDGDL